MHLYDVAIIGLGPTGAVLANLLGQLGVDTVVIEREPEPVAEPRAAHFDGEVMRVFQTIGLLDEVTSLSRPGLEGMRFVSGAGQTLMIRTASSEPGLHGHYNSWYFHQPMLERVLRDGLDRFESVVQRLGVEATAITQFDDHVRIETSTPDGGSAEVRARYGVGCEGGRSLTRRAIGTKSTDLGQHQDWLCVDVLMKRTVDLPAHSVQLCDPARPMTMVNMAGDRRRWEIMLLPDDDREAVTDPDVVWEFLSHWLEPGDAEIERSAVYTFHSLVADSWRDRRLFLAGDAAHQTPPFLGQGMCAGIRDASNLAWKLAAACRSGRQDVLETYQSERLVHAEAFIRLAVAVGEVIQLTDRAAAAERDENFARTGPELFAFPTPTLGPGVHRGPEPAGTPMPQLRTADGRWFDDVVGPRWSIIATSELLSGAGDDLRQRAEAAGIAVIEQSELITLGGDSDTHRSAGVLVRPDRYVAFVASDGAELEDALLLVEY